MQKELILWTKKLLIILAFAIILYGIYITSSIIITLLAAGFLTLLITPLVEKWKKYHIPEWLTVIVVYAVIILLASIVIGTIIPIIINYLMELARQITHWASTAQDTYIRYGIDGFSMPNWLKN